MDHEDKYENDDYNYGKLRQKPSKNLLERPSYVEIDENGRVTRPPYSLKNGATYTG